MLLAQTNNFKNLGDRFQYLRKRINYFLLCCIIIDFIAYNKFDRQYVINHSPSILILNILKFSSDL